MSGSNKLRNGYPQNKTQNYRVYRAIEHRTTEPAVYRLIP